MRGLTVAQTVTRYAKAISTVNPQDKHINMAVRALVSVAGHVRPQDLNEMHVLEAFATHSNNAHGTRYALRSRYKRLFEYLNEAHGAPPLAKHIPRLTPPAPRAVTATLSERAAILAACPLWLRCWVLLCSDLAMRNATAASISPADYDAEKGAVTFRTKFGSWQTLPVTLELAGIFARVAHVGKVTTPFVALLHPLGRVAKTWPSQKFTLVRRSVGVTRKLTAHDLRRTTALHVFEQTRDVRVVQAVLGHKQLSTTLYYLDHRNTPVPLDVLELAKQNHQAIKEVIQ